MGSGEKPKGFNLAYLGKEVGLGGEPSGQKGKRGERASNQVEGGKS